MFEFIRGLHNLRPQHAGCALTIGNFDGVHRGHQAVIARLRERAESLGVPATVMIFEPQPQEFFASDNARARPMRLMRLREKLVALADTGIERVLCLRFDARQAAMTADQFVTDVVVNGLGAKYVVVGDDFRYGRARTGDFESLRAAGERFGFEVSATETFSLDGLRVSSSAIRDALAGGDCATATTMLGRPYRIAGRVIRGEKIGRQIGVPTINIALPARGTPVNGIFVTAVQHSSGASWPGVASVGTRPTVGGSRPLLEVHLLDFDGDLYGQRMGVQFLHRLRDEKRFESLDAMRAAIDNDILDARAWFEARARQS
jgi:riboflavin kinase/FMN adenylyltransferase